MYFKLFAFLIICTQGIFTFLSTKASAEDNTKSIPSANINAKAKLNLKAIGISIVSNKTQVSVKATTLKNYFTNFEGAENIINESGVWTNGRKDGVDWKDVQKNYGYAFATDYNNGYDDSIAHLNGFSANHYAEAVVHMVDGYSTDNSHEVELLLRFKITARNARGYEICLGINGAYASIVRWNGPLNDFTHLNSTGIGPGALKEGDTIRATAVGSTITVYKNGVEVLKTVDSAWADGNPGMGFFVRPSGISILQNYSFASFKAGDL